MKRWISSRSPSRSARRRSACCTPPTSASALARAIRAAVSGRPGGVYLDLPAKLFGQVMDAEAGRKSLVKVIDAGAGADPGA